MEKGYLIGSSLRLAAALAGRAPTNSLRLRVGGTTFFEVHDKSYDQIWKAAIAAASSSLQILESNKETGIIRARPSMSLARWGEDVGIFVRPTSRANVYTVEVESPKTALHSPDWANTIISGMTADLDQ
jgi:hypothetical protein